MVLLIACTSGLPESPTLPTFFHIDMTTWVMPLNSPSFGMSEVLLLSPTLLTSTSEVSFTEWVAYATYHSLDSV